MAEAVQLYLQDFAPGQVFPGAVNDCTAEDFLTFAKVTGDAHPIHYDADYAAQTRFGKPLAHGLLVAAYSALGATPLAHQVTASMVAMLEVGFRYLQPVFAGDRLTSRLEVLSTSLKPGKESGVIRFRVTLTNQAGAMVVDGTHTYLMRARP